MNKTPSLTARLALAAALAFGGASAVMAKDIKPSAVGQVSVGQSMDSVHAAFGEATKHNSYLFAPGSSDLYYISGGTLGNEWVLQVNYDAQGRVTSTKRVNAEFYELNRLE